MKPKYPVGPAEDADGKSRGTGKDSRDGRVRTAGASCCKIYRVSLDDVWALMVISGDYGFNPREESTEEVLHHTH